MKRSFAVWMFAAFIAVMPTIAQEIKSADGTRIPMPAKVPAGKTYALFDAKGTLTKTVPAGAAVHLATEAPVDCVMIGCPPKFKPNTVCWKCEPR
jgi:hypothetical protein